MTARRLLRENEITASDLAEACFRQIERLNPALNAFITICPVAVARELREAAKTTMNTGRLRRLFSGPDSSTLTSMKLVGIPVAVKDLFETKGIRTTAGSKFFANYVPQEDAWVVQKLKEAGALIVGKTNTHEIALGVTTNNPHFGACRNPWDTARTPGGSSGGSAVAVATGMALAALGTDTGGSIRIPASLCGVVGLKPTYGRVSLRGVIPLSWNLDHAGPLTRTVEDAALMLQMIAGYDPLDPYTVKMLPPDFMSHIRDGVESRKIALASGRFINGADTEVLDAVHEAAGVFAKMGAQIEQVDADWMYDAAVANAIMTTADGAAFHRDRMREHIEWFGADVRERLEMGAMYSSSEYSLARRKQAEVRRRCEDLFDTYDVLILPTTPIAAPVFEGENAVERARLLTRFTAPFNLAGVPALSVPCGFTKSGLPIGLQIVSRAWNESGALRAGHTYQQATDWHTRRPEIAAI